MIKVYGVNDDLIEIEGDITEEFSINVAETNSGIVIGFSCGTLIKIVLGEETIWRISVLKNGQANIEHYTGTDPDTDYSDILTLENVSVDWILKGTSYIFKNRLVDLSNT